MMTVRFEQPFMPAESLKSLGDTADEVTQALRKNGVKGVRNTVRFMNPVVRFVQTQLRDDALHMHVVLGDMLHLIFPNGQSQVIPLPRPVIDFLAAFNRGDYPDLELPGKA